MPKKDQNTKLAPICELPYNINTMLYIQLVWLNGSSTPCKLVPFNLSGIGVKKREY